MMRTSSWFLILGLGISGRAVAEFLLQKGCRVIAVDRQADAIRSCVAPLIAQGLQLVDESASLPPFSQLILSPGISLLHPLVQWSLAKNIEVIGEIEFAFRHIRNRCIGVTGSNGKTTTVLLTTHLLNSVGRRACALGNVGKALSSYLLHPDPEEILVVELSSFQLETLQARCLDMAAILNITPNHLDRYRSMSEYIEAKISIQNCLKEGAKLLVSERTVKEVGHLLKKWEIYDKESASVLLCNQESATGKLNVLAARAICREFGVHDDDLRAGLASFQKPPHRIEWVAEIGGTVYYNDSKSSNIDSVMHAVNLLDGPIVLIAGGTDKGSSYAPWVECFKGKVKQIIAYGLAASKMERELAQDFQIEKRGPFKEAILTAYLIAKERDTVLLSPGCSSYDQFKSYEERGNVFKQTVKELKKQWIGKKQF